MNDLHHPCELWAERISLAAAGCLSADEQREVRRHIETCSDCRERFRQLTQMCGALAELQLPTLGTEAAIVERVMSVVASSDSEGTVPIFVSAKMGLSPLPDTEREVVSTRVEMIHPTLHTRSLTKWRWVMRHPVSSATAAAIFILAVIGVALWFHGGGTTPALADFIQPILDAKTAKFKMTVEIEGKQPITFNIMYLAPYRTHIEYEMPSKSRTIIIEDSKMEKSLVLTPDEKLAVITTFINTPAKQYPTGPGYFIEMRSQLLDASGDPDFKREPLGEKEIDGHQTVGYRLSGRHRGFPAMVFNFWADPKTMLPVRVEIGGERSDTKTKWTMTDFVFNVDLDESLFSLEPPAGYTIQTIMRDGSPGGENDLIETFRRYSQLSGGIFPDVLNHDAAARLFNKHWVKSHPPTWWKWLWNEQQSQEEKQEQLDELDNLTKGLRFVSVELPPDADAYYAGKGVSLGTADTPIFWYRPKDSKKYRVIYADLSVRDADAPPSVPNAQPVPDTSNPKK